VITTAALFLTLIAAPGEDQQPQQPAQQATPLILKMIDRYTGAKSMTGTIRLTQTAGNQSGTLDTVVQFEQPSKLYIRQQLNTASKKTWLITSDGKTFSFNKPEDTPGDDRMRLMEPVKHPKTGEVHDVRKIFLVTAQVLGDRSSPLMLAIGCDVDVKLFKAQLAQYRYEGKVKLGDEEVHAISGRWRENAATDPKADFELYITDAGDMRRYAIRQVVQPDQRSGPVTVVSTWDVNLTVDGTPDQSLFKVVR
jgi:hypothetical protein